MADSRKLVLITGEDAETDHGWEDVGDAVTAKPRVCHSVGWLIHQDEHSLVLAQTISDDQINGRICIPAAWVEGEIVPVETGGNVVDFKAPE